MAVRRDLLGPLRAKLQPKLQMIANGSTEVNVVRAELAPALTVTPRKPGLLRKVPARRGDGDRAVAREAVKALPARGELKAISGDVEANVFVYLNHASADGPALEGEQARRETIVSARVSLRKLPKLAQDRRVAYVEIAEGLRPPTPAAVAESDREPSPEERKITAAEAQHRFGRGVLVGIIDVGGFDFSHPDFLDEHGKTRWLRIWDQGGVARPHPPGRRFAYGAEFGKEDLDAALAAAGPLGVPAYEIERQSQLAEGSHGTHVASIAAGNRGVCRNADLAGVLISLPEADEDRRRSFYDSTRIADAVDYLVELAASKGMALSINMSLGTNGHAHDGSGAIGRWIDAAMSVPGRAITVAAGNAGQEKGEDPEDLGWIMGRVHTAGQIAATGLVVDVEWVVVGNGLVDISENELELWFSPQDLIDVSVRTPSGEWTEFIEPQQFIENRRLADGSFLSVYDTLYHPSNGANTVSVYLSPNLRSEPVVGVASGTWIVRLRGRSIRDGKFDGWIERDDPRPWRKVGDRQLWAFPSFFGERSLVDRSTVSSLGCGHRVITVANLDLAKGRINVSSSQGPTRDGRTRPDVAAPGTDIVAAKAFSTDGRQWISMTGTSMASPYVCGVVGLMLAVDPTLTAAQIEGILRSQAAPLAGATYGWVDDAGFGVIDPPRCLEIATRLTRPPTDRTGQ